jgi:ribosomal protein S18 acetylase RimI-like enzyme
VFVAGTHAFIYDIEVAEEQRRRGYGREILDAAARAAADLGARELGLNVFGFNEGARALYEKAGYATTQRTYRVIL